MFKKNLEKLNQLQDEAVALIATEKRVLLNWETGVGKTLPALRSAQQLKGKWLWLMSQNIQENNIKKEMLHFNINADITFVNYRSAKRQVNKQYTGVILDEAHRLTPTSAKDVAKINATYFVALSASVPEDRLLLLKKTIKYHNVSKITMKQAIKYGIIPPVHIIGVELNLDLDDNRYTVPIKRYNSTDKPQEFYSYQHYESVKFKPAQFVVRNCTLADKLKVIETEMEYWKQQNSKHYGDPKFRWIKDTKWLPLGALRKNTLAELKSKYIHLVQKLVDGKRYVVFNENIEQIESNEGTSIHSKLKKVDNLESIEEFNRGNINVLQVAKMINEGINLVNIDAIIILSLSSSDIQNIQRRGRSVRGETPTIYVMYVADTKDEENFIKFVQDYKDTTRIISINQLM